METLMFLFHLVQKHSMNQNKFQNPPHSNICFVFGTLFLCVVFTNSSSIYLCCCSILFFSQLLFTVLKAMNDKMYRKYILVEIFIGFQSYSYVFNAQSVWIWWMWWLKFKTLKTIINHLIVYYILHVACRGRW